MTPDGLWEASGLPTPEQVERAKPILRDALAKGLDDVWIGLTRWRFKPWPAPAPGRSQPCGHPLAARKISVVAGLWEEAGLATTCWACEVKQEIGT